MKRCCMLRVQSWPSRARVVARREPTWALVWPCSTAGASWNWLTATMSASSSISTRRWDRNSSSCRDRAGGHSGTAIPAVGWQQSCPLPSSSPACRVIPP